MATLIVFSHSESGDRKAKKMVVSESFAEVIEKICPLTPPSSSLENRTSMIFTLPDGRQTFVNTPVVRIVENCHSIDEDEEE